MKIRCLIIDDKPLAIDILTDYAEKVSFLELVGSATNPIRGLELIASENVQLVFLDIQMPELSGLQLMKIAGGRCRFILTTAYSNYALEGYEHDVIDYLLKPVSFERFYRAAEKARLSILGAVPLNSVNSVLPTAKEREYIFVKTEHRLQKVNLQDILYIEGMQNYVLINTEKERIMSLQTFKKLEAQLPERDFIRVHKSYLVSLRHISSIERGLIRIAGTTIPIGESYKNDFYSRIG
ncbi:MAG: response regulator transcription factor [Sphingobacteriaceae bacterium]|nr:MAG: response regulator transcription factor [Sphingobacteriaceae bacterium]